MRELEQGEPVRLCGLQKAPQLNNKRGVVQRRDPRPTQRGRWEVELRLPGGKLEVKSIKLENIMPLNKADKVDCRMWMKDEKEHRQERKALEAEEELKQYRDAVEAKIRSMPLKEAVKGLLRQLEPKKAFDILEKSETKTGTPVVNAFIETQAKLLLFEDSEDEDDDDNEEEPEEVDPEQLPKEREPFPHLPPWRPEGQEMDDLQLDMVERARQEAVDALEQSDVGLALEKYTEALEAGGSTALLLSKRAELLLGQRRPCAAIRDCSAAIEHNPDCGKAYRVRGIAHRKLGNWEEAGYDLAQGQKLDFDQATVKVHNFVALKVNALQEKGPAKKRKAGADGVSPKKPRAA